MNADDRPRTGGERRAFLEGPRFEGQPLYDSDRLPNVVTTTDGTVLAIWGGYGSPDAEHGLRVRRSEDGGETWGEPIEIGTGENGGGALVDETTGDVLAFVDFRDDSDPRMFRSTDDGETWTRADVTFHEDENGNVPALHMCEHGITLRRGPHAGRLLRPARVYGERGYNTALYSDDGGETWHPSAPFPDRGTGEGAVAELSDGRIYYSSRKHHFAADEPMRADRRYAWSEDGGDTWTDPAYDDTLPDGPRYRDEDGRGASHNGHFGMMCGLVRLPIEGEDVLLYSNADNAGYQRRDLTVWASFDGAETWPVKRRVYDRQSAYSSLTAGRPETESEGWIYLLFEHGKLTGDETGAGGYPKITQTGATLARFDLAWLVRGELTGDGELPEWVGR